MSLVAHAPTAGPRLSETGIQSGSALAIAGAVVLGMATVVLAVLTNGSFIAFAAPVLVVALVAMAWVAPIRMTLCVAMFVSLATDRPGDSEGRWASPFVAIGGVMFQNLNNFITVEALKFSGVFLLLACLLVVRGYRVLSGRARDTKGSLQPAAPVIWSLVLAVLTIVACVTFGALRGGDLEMAKIQVQAYLQLLAVAYLFGISLRGERDYRLLATAIVSAACIKAVMALWVRNTLTPIFSDQWGQFREMEYATNHGDSLLFACAIAILAAPLFYKPTARHVRGFLLLAPVIVTGLVANDRRIAWLQVAIVMLVLLAMNGQSLFTRRAVHLVKLASPILLVYALVGWASPSRVFAPVQLVRSVVQAERTDGSIDRSTLYRDIENFNLVYTFQSNPLLGTGFGHPFQELVRGDDLSIFVEYAFLPHNSMVGLWTFTGAAGFTGIFSIIIVTLFLAARVHARAVSPHQGMAAAAAIGCIGSYGIHLWGDIGFTEQPTIFLVGLAIAVTSQLAVSTGAWPARWRQYVRSSTASGPRRMSR